MERYKLGEMEERFADLIWETAPVTTGEPTKLCEDRFSWKRTTIYTMLKRLCDRGLFAQLSGGIFQEAQAGRKRDRSVEEDD